MCYYNSLKETAYPICPLNIYFEGDENKCDVSKCDFDIKFRCCTENCKIKDNKGKK